MSDNAGVLLDRAKAAREVALVTALALMATGGDGRAALAIQEANYGPDVAPQGDELDCLSISAQAIREAMAMRGES